MKILQLSFQNLNSLYGKWNIDFARQEKESGGLFALTGPTGAGKSTVLDAICLALYGETPRLSRINASENEIMSRQTAYCQAEVTFSCIGGIFRCHFSQHRSRGSVTGRLQQPKYEFVDVENNAILATKKGAVVELVVEKTGMDFSRFTRSILLAQGSFDSFLKAKNEEKSQILERITGTEIYSEISLKVHERLREEKELFARLEAERAGVSLLDSQEIETLVMSLGRLEHSLLVAGTCLAEHQRAFSWRERIDVLSLELEKIEKEEALFEREREAFSREAERLESGRRAAVLEKIFAPVQSYRKQQQDSEKTKASVTEKIPNLEILLDQKSSLLQKNEQRTVAAQLREKESAPVLKQVRLMDAAIVTGQKMVKDCSSSYENEKKNVDDLLQKLAFLEQREAVLKQKLEALDEWRRIHAEDRKLVSELTGIQERIIGLTSAHESAEEFAKRLKEAREGYLVVEKQHQVLIAAREKEEITLAGIREKIKELNAKKNVLLGDFELETLRREEKVLLRELELLRKIASLEEERSRLKAGDPCPLCGSTVHPYVTEVPELSETEKRLQGLEEKISTVERIEKEIISVENKERQILARLNTATLKETSSGEGLKSRKEKGEELAEAEKEVRGKYLQLKEKLEKELEVMEIDVSLSGDEILGELYRRQHLWLEKEEVSVKWKEELSEVTNMLQAQQLLRERSEKQKFRLWEDLEKQRSVVTEEKRKRKILFEDRKPDDEEILLQKQVEVALKEEKSAKDVVTAVHEQIQNLKAALATLAEQEKHRIPEQERAEMVFQQNLKKNGFSGEEEFLAVRLPERELEKLTVAEKRLAEKVQGLRARKGDREHRLEMEKKRALCTVDREELGTLVHSFQMQRDQLLDERATIRQKLQDDDAKRKGLSEVQGRIDAQRVEVDKWARLHGLVGSSDGKKFRNFAQGLTFDLVVAHASRQLVSMGDRYILVHDRRYPLQLSVVDNYQAGEVRPTDNLSGGESFLVSLALALGLSKMASRKIRVDSLFLDEGFGTLDEESLETALDALGTLQQSGKLIGVISHVGALKERIPNQIEVVPVSGGKSILKGSGVRSPDFYQ